MTRIERNTMHPEDLRDYRKATDRSKRAELARVARATAQLARWVKYNSK
jgi:hypothetical protein